jgi:hypothetical protein
MEIRIHILKKDRQHNSQKKDRQHNSQKKDRQHNSQKKDRQHNSQKKDRQHNDQKKKRQTTIYKTLHRKLSFHTRIRGRDRHRMVDRIYNYLRTQCLSSLMLWVRIPLRRGVLDTALCYQVCQWLSTGRWLFPGNPDSSNIKTEIMLKVALNTIALSKGNNKITELRTIFQRESHNS